jgi:hypothetical protein
MGQGSDQQSRALDQERDGENPQRSRTGSGHGNKLKEYAPRLGISEFDVSDIRLSLNSAVKERPRLFRGQEYSLDLVSGVKVEFVASDEDAREVAENIFALVAPERVVMWPLDALINIPATAPYVVPRCSTGSGASERMPLTH